MKYKGEFTHEQRAVADAALTSRLNVIHHVYVDITGDLVAGALLGQINYWFGSDRNGQTRARIIKGGHYWIAKTRNDWWNEIRISAKQYDRAAKILRDKGFIEQRTMKFNGNPTTHTRIIAEALNAAIDSWKWERVREAGLLPIGEQPAVVGYSPLVNNELTEKERTILPNGGQPYTPNVNLDFPHWGKSLTENTAETTIENTADNTNTSKRAFDAVAYFEDIWSNYPKREGKAKAQGAYIEALRANVAPEKILVAVALYRQYIEHAVTHNGLERRYIPTGGAWFAGRRWEDDIPRIASGLGFDQGGEYNRLYGKLKTLANQAQEASGEDRAAIREQIAGLLYGLPY